MKKITKIIVLCVLLAAAVFSTAFRPEFLVEESTLQDLVGTWKGNFRVFTSKDKYFNDAAVMNIIEDGGDYSLYLTVNSCDAAYITINSWKVDGNTLLYNFNEMPWQTSVSLEFQGDNELVGTYTQYGTTREISFKRASSQPTDLSTVAQFVIENETDEAWFEHLSEYQTYDTSDNGLKIPFTYELNNKEGLQNFINANKIDALMRTKKTDIDRMMALMDVVCNNFKHDGASGMPEERDAASLIDYAKKIGSIECTGLSTILSELCRAYGIPAKPIKCTPYTDEGEFCHVVVHAYSGEKKQWIMLDPTYRLILKDLAGNYVSLETLRQSLVDGEKLTPNATAGRNGRLFYMEHYRVYMAKNGFRFSSLLNVSSATGAVSGGKLYMLQPEGFPTKNAYYRGETPTTSAEAFWAAP